MKAMRSLAAVSALVMALAGCGGGGTTPSLPSGFNNNPTGIAPNLIVRDWGESAMQGASYVGPATNAHLAINLLVHQQNAAGLAQYALDVSNPASGSFRQFLTPQEIAARFGASQSDYLATAQYFVNHGLSIAGWPQRMLLTVAGDQAHMEKAFGTTFGVYRRSGQTFIAPRSVPHFDAAIPVDAVGRIVSFQADHAYMIAGPPHAGAGFAVGYSPSVVRAAFDYVGAYKAGFTGSNITIGIIGTGPIDVGGARSGDLDLDALATATGTTNVAHVTQQDVTKFGVTSGLTITGGSASPPPFPYSGDFAAPPPVTSPNCPGTLPACNPEDGEAQLDVQQTATLAPGANVYFYLGYNQADCTTVTFPSPCPTGTGTPYIGINEADPEIQQAIADDKADVISISYGGGESQQGWTKYPGSYQQLEFAAMLAEGMAVFVSSGDSGSAECLSGSSTPPFYLGQQCVSYPSGDPSVTSVGGITANVDGFGNPLAPFLAWGISTASSGYGVSDSNGGASGGGTSTQIAATASQHAATGATMREQPDVSLIGDPSTGIAMMQNFAYGGTLSDIGGTSVAAPEMAAMWAVVLSACNVHQTGLCSGGKASSNGGYRLGNAAQYLYAIYKPGGGLAPALPYNEVFYDILYGDNQMQNPSQPTGNPIPGFPAMTGYDEVTGVGTPYAGHLIQAMTGISVP